LGIPGGGWRPVRTLKSTIVALAAVPLAAPASAAAHDRLPDAEIFATNNTAVITDPDDTEGSNDTLAIDTSAGDDTVDTSGLPDGTIRLEVD
jgi:hypothetical protein